ncbi:MAG: class I SAM-dependent methyltransferase [Acidobacteriota bacterium]
MSFKDHFSGHADRYAAARPSYPSRLIDYIADAAPGRSLVWDCGAGNGQAAVSLAQRFAAVRATDASAQQLAQASEHPRVTYRQAREDQSGLPDGAADLVTAAQAAHWFDLDKFYRECRRVLRTNGVVAVWCYGTHRVEPAIDEVTRLFYDGTLATYWPPERAIVDRLYAALDFPFEELDPPPFELHCDWRLGQLLDYIESWSATQRYRATHNRSPMPELVEALTPLWGDPMQARAVRWPIGLRIGRVTP